MGAVFYNHGLITLPKSWPIMVTGKEYASVLVENLSHGSEEISRQTLRIFSSLESY